jgi:hypothetical protein
VAIDEILSGYVREGQVVDEQDLSLWEPREIVAVDHCLGERYPRRRGLVPKSGAYDQA